MGVYACYTKGVSDGVQGQEQEQRQAGQAVSEPITFPAQVVKVQTLADSGLRLTLDLPETEIVAFAWLAECKRVGVVLNITAQPDNQVDTGVKTGNVSAGAIGQPEGQAENTGAVRTSAGRGKQDNRGRRQASRG